MYRWRLFLSIGVLGLLVCRGYILTVDVNGDDLTGYDNVRLGTNPFSTDTDGDGLSDYNEVNEYDATESVAGP